MFLQNQKICSLRHSIEHLVCFTILRTLMTDLLQLKKNNGDQIQGKIKQGRSEANSRSMAAGEGPVVNGKDEEHVFVIDRAWAADEMFD
ncbi:hypothetical protein L1887_05056 [Cichorium endivia]|nr:hypothetical protein L1887_05054 [Cichorium endivia]KAI3525923.1 hypothetical protein L1887_05056 [Cichorium endivia]